MQDGVDRVSAVTFAKVEHVMNHDCSDNNAQKL